MGCLPDTLCLTDDQAKLLVAIANHVRQGDAIPSDTILGQEIGLPYKRVRACLMYLEEAGILDQEEGSYELAPDIITEPLLARVAIFILLSGQILPVDELIERINQEFSIGLIKAAQLVEKLMEDDYLEKAGEAILPGDCLRYERRYLEELAVDGSPIAA